MTFWLWAGFILFVFAMLAVDLGVFHRRPHAVSTKESLIWTGVWIALSLLFNVLIYFMYEHHWLGIGVHGNATESGKQAALEYLTGYLIEKSLSLDNIFVFAIIFGYFAVPNRLQHRVLFWGILGALIMRGGMIAAGVALIERFEWIVIVFGAILIFTAARLAFRDDTHMEPGKTWPVRLARRFLPMTDTFHEQRFVIKRDGKRLFTPLFLVLIVVESTDVLFAVDSIPAIFAVTRDPFIVFTSNVFAILGLRALYFALASVIDRFHYLKLALVIILAFVGTKMIIAHWNVHIPVTVSLGVIIGVIIVAIIASVRREKKAGGGQSDAAADAAGQH